MTDTTNRTDIADELRHRGLAWIFEEVDDLANEGRLKTHMYDGVLVLEPDEERKTAAAYYAPRSDLYTMLEKSAPELVNTLARMKTPARAGHTYVLIMCKDGAIFFAEYPLAKDAIQVN